MVLAVARVGSPYHLGARCRIGTSW
jgi:hypothetical protein